MTQDARLQVTPEIHTRATQFLANRILVEATSMGTAKQRLNKLRTDYGLGLDPAMDVQELAAQMGVQVAQMISSGKLVLALVTTAPESSGNPGVLRVEPTEDEWEVAWNRIPNTHGCKPWRFFREVSAEAYRLAAEREGKN